MSSTVQSLDPKSSAADSAAVAASRAGIEIRRLDDLPAIQMAADLLRAIWGPEDRDVVGATTLRALSHSENCIFGAYDGAEMVGAIAGFVGWHKGSLQLHSHILGVSPEAQGRNVGFALKQHQRAWSLNRDIKLVTWTFDPLVSRNAYFNLTKLGGSITAYYPSFYGAMNDGINGRDESDRVLVEWALDSSRAIDAGSGAAQAPDVEVLRRGGAQVALTADTDAAPKLVPISGNTVLVGVPLDIVELRRSDTAAASRWRQVTREVLGGALGDGYVVVSMTRSGYYILERTK